jgi:DNA-binding CsgD family transcriptional regulator
LPTPTPRRGGRCATCSPISNSLFVAEETVYGHVKNMLRKLGVKSRAEALSAAGTLRQVVDGA